MNIKEIKEMITIMNENDLVELEIEKEGARIRLKKTAAVAGMVNQPIAAAKEPFQVEISQKPQPAVPASEIKSVEIKAPMVGTFYRAPSPESPPYVEVGQVIESGQVICIIEAMKLMNEIKSEIKGKVIEIFVDNAEPVEFGQSLFHVEPL